VDAHLVRHLQPGQRHGRRRARRRHRGRFQNHCADPAFGALGPGETPIAFLLFKDNGSDATNVPMGWYPKATPQRTDELNPFKAQLNSGRALVLSATQFQ
jgi:hypothetical protein